MQNDLASIPSSGPVAASDLAAGIARADLIVAAQVMRVSDADAAVTSVSADAAPEYDRVRQAQVQVLRTLKGEPPSDSLTVLFLQGKVPSRPWLELTPGETVLLFLRARKDTYVPVAPGGRTIPAVQELTPAPRGASVSEAVAHELEGVLLQADPHANSGAILQATTARMQLQTTVDLARLDEPILQDPARRAAWVAIALAAGQIKALSDVESIYRARTLPPETLSGFVLQKVSELRSPAARPALANLLRSSNAELARAAVTALRQLHDPNALPDLIKALDYPDREVRYAAVMALAELEPGIGGGPAFEAYKRDESRYIEQWKQWWSSRSSR